MEILSKKEARELGIKTYFTGKECPRGHISERYVSTGGCKQCISEKSIVYHRSNNFASAKKFREKNPERIKEIQNKYYMANKAKSRQWNIEWSKNNQARFLFLRSKSSAKKRGIEFNITIDDILPIGDTCPILGTKFTANSGHENRETAPSIDRIDSRKGYIPGNVWVISYRANRIKNDATVEELEAIARAVRKKIAQ